MRGVDLLLGETSVVDWVARGVDSPSVETSVVV